MKKRQKFNEIGLKSYDIIRTINILRRFEYGRASCDKFEW